MTQQCAPVRLGLVGLNFGRNIYETLVNGQQPSMALVRVCDLDVERVRAVNTRGIPVAASLDAMLDDPDVEAIGLFTGPVGRAELIRRIIRAGKDVMTTKPFEVDPAAALDVLQEARALGRVVHLNSPNPRAMGEAAQIRQWVAEGRIGRPTLAQSSVWCYYGATPADGTWYDDPQRCPAAPLFRLGIYPLNVLLPLFAPPQTVQVSWSRVETLRPTPDNASMTIRCADGALLTLSASFVVGGRDQYKNALTIGGTGGVIYFQEGPRPADAAWEGNLQLATAHGIERATITTRSGEYDWEFFAQRVRGMVEQDEITPAQVVMPLRVIQAMSRAEASGCTETVE